MTAKSPRRYRSVTVTLPLWESLRRLYHQGEWVRQVVRFEEVLPSDPGYEDAELEEVFFMTVGYQGEFKWVNIQNEKP